MWKIMLETVREVRGKRALKSQFLKGWKYLMILDRYIWVRFFEIKVYSYNFGEWTVQINHSPINAVQKKDFRQRFGRVFGEMLIYCFILILAHCLIIQCQIGDQMTEELQNFQHNIEICRLFSRINGKRDFEWIAWKLLLEHRFGCCTVLSSWRSEIHQAWPIDFRTKTKIQL